MQIDQVHIKGFRNFFDASIKVEKSTLVIGANDVGKTNLIHALRLLLDKSMSEIDIEPCETDFHIDIGGHQSSNFCITIFFSNITEESVLSYLKGRVSSDMKSVFRMSAARETLSYKFSIGSNEQELEEIDNRFYTKFINLRYVRSRRDLQKFIELEKKQLLRISQQSLDENLSESDRKQMIKISRGLEIINGRIRQLNYVKGATDLVNEELQKLSYNFSEYSVHLDSGSIKVHQFIDNLQLAASTSGSKMALGGDGRNNQILMALWKVKSQREFESGHEVVFYCIEEPEAHLHPHQQRKLADYLINGLPGQTIITSHSPQITARYKPNSIVHIINSKGKSHAAAGGCSSCISEAWDDLGYRMSILPAEAFFARCVLLVEGPSEQLFYSELSKSLGIDLDYYNISILAVDGIAFEVYTKVLDAMEIGWVIRTDNDLARISSKKNGKQRILSGINRCLALLGLENLPHREENITQRNLLDDGTWGKVSEKINPKGIFLAKVDLEHDLAEELPDQLMGFSNKHNIGDAIKYMQAKKAINMRKFLHEYRDSLKSIKDGELAKPLLLCKTMIA